MAMKRVADCRPVAVRRSVKQRLSLRMMSEKFWKYSKIQNWRKVAMNGSKPKLSKNCSAEGRRCTHCFSITSEKP